ncbi:retron Eco8 family effector endonuclease [Paenibacillus sp. FSL R5-0749]|uniref:retron Eco8 family effector endonuclease n=1 Tax=Paenibacillus sp. FSL R5-0749 TaxID=2921657 RepID=UPI003159A242
MAIRRIKINNFKSLRSVDITLNNISCLLGENGSGKSNFLKAVHYFYLNMTASNFQTNLHDKHNPYVEDMEITIWFDFKRIISIAKSHRSAHRIYNHEFKPFFRKILSMHKSIGDDNELISLTLTQRKREGIIWSLPYESRVILKNLFPVYFVNARHINLTNWDELWETIGDLGTLEIKDRPILKIKQALEECLGTQYKKIAGQLENELNTANLELDSFRPKLMFSHLYQLQLGGHSFRYRNEELDYYSDGLNSYNYIKLLSRMVIQLSELRLKEPLIILDEPETGLHPRFLDDLSKTISQDIGFTGFLIATHSPRIIRNLLNIKDDKSTLYHIQLKDQYTSIGQMKGFTDNREIQTFTEQEASFYFAKAILFVEGVTELELFSNTELINLFPKMKDIDIFPFSGNSVRLKSIHPAEKNISIPYLILTDMDKIMQFEPTSNHFSPCNDTPFLNPLKNVLAHKKEMFYYSNRKIQTYGKRKQIEGLMRNCEYYPDPHWGTIESPYFHKLRNSIKEYCILHHVFPVSTTVEGLLINSNNYSYVWEYICHSEKNPQKLNDLNTIFNYSEKPSYKTTILRMLYGGKADHNLTNRQRYGESKSPKFEPAKEIYEKISKYSYGKTSGWVTTFLNYVFLNVINKASGNEREQLFKAIFPELYNLISIMIKLKKD